MNRTLFILKNKRTSHMYEITQYTKFKSRSKIFSFNRSGIYSTLRKFLKRSVNRL